MKKKILWLGLSFLLVAALLLASCGKAEPGEQEEEEEEEEPVGEQEEEEEEEEPVGQQEEEEEEEEPAVGVPQYGGTYTVIYFATEDAGSADVQTQHWPALAYSGNVLERPMRGDYEKYGPRGTDEYDFGPHPFLPMEFLTGALAESWDVAPDRLTFHVRPGIYWTGKSINPVMERREYVADDLVFNLRRFLQLPYAASIAGLGFIKTPYEESIYAVDKYTVVVELARFHSDWWLGLGTFATAYNMAPETVEAGPEEWENIVGTGPFYITENVHGSHLGYARNPDYWRTSIINGVEYELPFIDELIMPFIPDESTRMAALRTGVLDACLTVDSMPASGLDMTAPDMLSAELSSGDVHIIALRLDRPPLDDINVRRALMMATDQELIFETIFDGVGELYAFPLAKGISGYIPLEELPPATRELFEYNPVKAKQLLADAGYPNGLDVVIEIGPTGWWPLTAEMLVPMWEKIGIRTELIVHEGVALSSIMMDMRNEMIMIRHCQPLAATNFAEVMLTDGYINLPHYSNQYYDELVKQAFATVDSDERLPMLEELFLLTLEEVAFIPFGMQSNYVYWWPWVKNYYGERNVGCVTLTAETLWIDQKLKAEMGY